MYQAKTLAEFHFDTKRSGDILCAFLADAKISKASAAKILGYPYDTFSDALHGHNKDSKMEIVVKVCAITNRTVQEWCEQMLQGVDEAVACQVRHAFTVEAAQDTEEQIRQRTADFFMRWLDAQGKSIDLYTTIREEMRRQYEDEIRHLREENRRLLDALLS